MRAHPAPAGAHLVPSDVASLRASLVEERNARAAQIAHVPEHTDAHAAELLVAQAVLDEVRAALSRLEDGTYGWCTRCLEPIPRRLLHALPRTRFCRACLG